MIVADITFAAAKDTAVLIYSSGGRAFPYALDVADPVSPAALADYVRRVHGVPDVVVNNAGLQTYWEPPEYDDPPPPIPPRR